MLQSNSFFLNFCVWIWIQPFKMDNNLKTFLNRKMNEYLFWDGGSIMPSKASAIPFRKEKKEKKKRHVQRPGGNLAWLGKHYLTKLPVKMTPDFGQSCTIAPTRQESFSFINLENLALLLDGTAMWKWYSVSG